MMNRFAFTFEFIDINECDGDHKCKYKCHNTQGSFKCLCPDGYKLKGDARSCEGENN